jgi:hypothetical protein
MKLPDQSFVMVSHPVKKDFWLIKHIEMRSKFQVLLMVPVFFISVEGSAQVTEISTDRPDQSNTPLVIPTGALQIETGFIVEQETTLSAKNRNYTYNNTLLKFGINEYFEVRLNTLYQGVTTSSDIGSSRALGPVSVGLKVKLADEHGAWPLTSVISHINLRSGSTEFKPSYTSSDITLACSHELTEQWSITYNAGVKWDGESPAATALYALSIAREVTGKLSVFAESYAFFSEQNKPDHRMDAGITYKINPLFQWDLSGGLGLSKNAPDNFLSTGLSIRLFN